ncbi:hypothetical protein C7S18_07830 [Ahniella affigens]|uniref:Uncharacterized protein n=1 Tax=Ahniella affigens TaxID=2021234 RepID=A0A2P1PQI1_9GAMM|nr:DUF6116 family protein [Ahniella affigens]AVP97106.1 hypothetical protein C7S18_07830 [Ahniella affigens]
MSNPIVTQAVSRLKYPWLLALTMIALIVDVLIPDFVPFIDELTLAAMTALFAMWRERRPVPMKTVASTSQAGPKAIGQDGTPPKLP